MISKRGSQDGAEGHVKAPKSELLLGLQASFREPLFCHRIGAFQKPLPLSLSGLLSLQSFLGLPRVRAEYNWSHEFGIWTWDS